MLRQRYHELMSKIGEHKGQKYFIVGDYVLDKTLHKIKKIICIGKFDDSKILIDVNDGIVR